MAERVITLDTMHSTDINKGWSNIFRDLLLNEPIVELVTTIVMFIIIIITCVEHPYLAEDGGQDVLVEVPHLPDQALGRTPERDHQVRHGQVDQVVVHRGPGREEARKDKA